MITKTDTSEIQLENSHKAKSKRNRKLSFGAMMDSKAQSYICVMKKGKKLINDNCQVMQIKYHSVQYADIW